MDVVKKLENAVELLTEDLTSLCVPGHENNASVLILVKTMLLQFAPRSN
jgi:hypothetical protein